MTLRQHAGITRQEVAQLCAVTEATVRRWEDASKPPPRAIVLLLHLSGGQLGVLDPAGRTGASVPANCGHRTCWAEASSPST